MRTIADNGGRGGKPKADPCCRGGEHSGPVWAIMWSNKINVNIPESFALAFWAIYNS